MILRKITDWPARVLPSPFEELESIRRPNKEYVKRNSSRSFSSYEYYRG